MANFVIVHGGWGGGWEWTPVARRLRQRNHEVFTPTLTGLGERAHLGSEIGLSNHIDDVLAVFMFEDLRNVILCGHSYGGMVVTGVADRIPERLRLLVYLDAFVPNDGQALRDLMPKEFGDVLLPTAEGRGDGKFPYPPELHPPEDTISAEVRTSYISRTRPHPIATMREPLHLSGAINTLPRAFVRCTNDLDPDVMGPFAARARAEGWPYREIATAHDLHLIDPDETTAILDDLATSVA
ncbi:MAG: alpha/beta hydrolase [Caldilineaceae bacterium]|nr:alpha/beta hydrolase [Caldilineaceae bacterium]